MVSNSFFACVSSRRRATARRRRLSALFGLFFAFFAIVTYFSTIGRSSFAFGNVVVICSCLISAAAILANIALRCSWVRFSFLSAKPWRIFHSPFSQDASSGRLQFLLFVLLREIFDIFRRPIRHVHAEMQTERCEEIRRAH